MFVPCRKEARYAAGVFEVELHFHGDLPQFLRRELRTASPVVRALKEKTAVKDVIEACGVPHTEVDLLLIGGCRPVAFAWTLESADRVDVHSVRSANATGFDETARLQVRDCDRFIADGHLGKLARNLRLLGLDTAYERDADDRRLLEIMAAENRALLTRDRRLLMHSIVRHGYCPRSSDAEEQTREVLERFSLRTKGRSVRPYSRCLECNHLPASVEKAEVLEPLAGEPLTLRYYDTFRRCPGCGRVFWQGTHFAKLSARVQRLLC
jgi:uncharacterized protein with PIN domain